MWFNTTEFLFREREQWLTLLLKASLSSTLSNHWYDVDKLVQSLHELNINSPQTVNNKQTNNKIT